MPFPADINFYDVFTSFGDLNQILFTGSLLDLVQDPNVNKYLRSWDQARFSTFANEHDETGASKFICRVQAVNNPDLYEAIARHCAKNVYLWRQLNTETAYIRDILRDAGRTVAEPEQKVADALGNDRTLNAPTNTPACVVDLDRRMGALGSGVGRVAELVQQ